MKPAVRYALLLGAVLSAGVGVAWAQIDNAPPPPSRDYASSGAFGHGRGATKFFAEFDLNHDGKVTRDELNRALAAEFTQVAGNAPAMNQAQFLALKMKDLRQHTDQMFRRDDWNGDGRLSLEEYAAPERVRFEYADRDGTGVIGCGFRSNGPYAQPQNGRHSSGGRGRGLFCKVADLNHDGQVTRAEFDRSVQQEFASAAKGGTLAPDGFYAIIAGHVRDGAQRNFTRLDRNRDGKIDRGEFADSETKHFAAIDRNNDGAVTRDEFYSGRRFAANNRKPKG